MVPADGAGGSEGGEMIGGNEPVQPLTVKDIVVRYLIQEGYDGLYSDADCGCELGDLFPCGSPFEECCPGYKAPCACGEGHYFDIVAKKPKPEPPVAGSSIRG